MAKSPLPNIPTGFFTLAANAWRMRIGEVTASTAEQNLGF
jgi:hypothetical protein